MSGEALCGSSAYFWIYAGILESSCIFLGPASVDHGFCGIGARSVLRRDRCSPPRRVACGRRRFGRHSDLMATMFPSVKMDGALIEVVPDRSTCLDIFIRRLKRCLAAFSMLMVGVLPLGAAAQVTQPLLPNAVPPSLPQALAPPGEQPIYAGQTVIDRARPEFDPVGLRFGDFF